MAIYILWTVKNRILCTEVHLKLGLQPKMTSTSQVLGSQVCVANPGHHRLVLFILELCKSGIKWYLSIDSFKFGLFYSTQYQCQRHYLCQSFVVVFLLYRCVLFQFCDYTNIFSYSSVERHVALLLLAFVLFCLCFLTDKNETLMNLFLPARSTPPLAEVCLWGVYPFVFVEYPAHILQVQKTTQ